MKPTVIWITLISITLFYSCKSKEPEPEKSKRFVSEQYSRVIDNRKTYSNKTLSFTESGALTVVKTTDSDTTQAGWSNSTDVTNYEYNLGGYLIKQTQNYSGLSTFLSKTPTIESIKSEFTYQYDSNNRLSKQVLTLVGSAVGTGSQTREFIYDAAGKLASCVVMMRYSNFNAGETWKKIFTYQHGVLVKYTEQEVGSSSVYDEYFLSANGLLLQRGTGRFIFYKKAYDSANNLIKVESFAGHDYPGQVVEYMYDKASVPESFIPKFLGHPQEAIADIEFYQSPNNIIKEVTWRADDFGSLSKQSEVSYTASYNAEGLFNG